jgi:two-component system, cell cycle sensor histidine kinase and response regulator CckA
VVRILRRKGYGVLEAGDGEEALEVAREFDGPLHLLLTDVVMPRMQGPELAEQVRALRPGIRVVLMSGHTENPQVRGTRLADAFPFLPKPFNAVDLLREVRKALGEPVERPVPG